MDAFYVAKIKKRLFAEGSSWSLSVASPIIINRMIKNYVGGFGFLQLLLAVMEENSTHISQLLVGLNRTAGSYSPLPLMFTALPLSICSLQR